MDKDRARPVLIRVWRGGRQARLARQVPGRCLARQLVTRWEHPRRQLRRRQSHAVEGEPEGRMGMRERREQLSDLFIGRR